MQKEIHTVDPLVPDLSPFAVETSIAKLKWYKLPGTDQILTKLTQEGSEHYVLGSINSLILFGIRKNCLSSGRSIRLYQCTSRAIKLIVVIIVGYHCYQLHNKLYSISSSQG
jgi:hypothetical protein